MAHDFPAWPRLSLAIGRAAACLLEEDARALPIDPVAIIARRGWKLRTYTHMAKRGGVTVDEIAGLYGRDAVASVMLADDQPAGYLVCYNDSIQVQERIAFSLAHEIGHVLLDHFSFGTYDDLSPAQRHVLDQEANAFAANLLAPCPLLAAFRRPLGLQDRQLFGLSKASWQTRLDALPRDAACLPEETSLRLQAQFAAFLRHRRCADCGAVFASRDQCPACGSRHIAWSPEDRSAFPWTAAHWRAPSVIPSDELENPLADDALWGSDDRGL